MTPSAPIARAVMLNRLVRRMLWARDALVLTLCATVVAFMIAALLPAGFAEPVSTACLSLLFVLFVEAAMALWWMTHAAWIARGAGYALSHLGLALLLVHVMLLGAIVLPTLVRVDLKDDRDVGRVTNQT